MKTTMMTIILIMLIFILALCYAEGYIVYDEYDLLTVDEVHDGVLLDPDTLFAYKILDDQTVKIIRYTWICSDVDIPEEIQGRKVSCVGDYAFLDTPVKNIFLPNTDIHLSECSFDYCDGVVWVDAKHPTLRIISAIVQKDSLTIEYYHGINSINMPKLRNYIEFDD